MCLCDSLAVDAVVCHAPETVLPQRRMAELTQGWWEEYSLEHRVLSMTAPPRVPFFVCVRVADESTFLVHHESVLLR